MPSTLTPAGWKKLLKEHPDAADAAPLTKALEDYGRAEGKDGAADVEAIDKVVARAEAAKKKNAKVKPLVAFLDGLIGDAEKERIKAAKAAEAEAAEADDEKDAGAALKASLVRVKKLDPDAARPFVLALGAVAGLVIPKRAPITRDHRNQARAMRTGKGKLLYGKCYGEGGKHIFEMEDKPPGGLTKLIKKAAKVHANLELRLKVRGAGDELDDETDTAELTDFGDETQEAPATGAGAEPIPPTDQATAFAARAKAAKASLDRLAGLDAGRAAPLKAELAAALGHAQAGRLNQAVGLISSMENRLAAALREAESGGGVTEPTEEAEPTEAERVKVEAKRALELIERVRKKNPDPAALLKTSVATALGHAQAGRTAEALEGLDRVIARSERLLGSAPGGPVPTPTPPGPEADWSRRLKELTPAIKAALQAGGPSAQEVKLKFSEAQVFARKGEFARAVELMGEIGGLVGPQAGGAEGPSPSGDAPREGIVASRKAMLAWDGAKKIARARLASLQSALLKDFPEYAGAAESIGTALDGYSAGLDDLLSSAVGARGDAQRRAIHRAALRAIKKFRAFAGRDPLIAEIDGNPLGIKPNLTQVLVDALDLIARTLAPDA